MNPPTCPPESPKLLPARIDGEARSLRVKRRTWLLSALYLVASGVGVASFAIIGNDSRVVYTSIIFSTLVALVWAGSMFRLRKRRVSERLVAFAVGFSCGAFVGGLSSLLFAMYSENTPRFMVLLFVWSVFCGAYRANVRPMPLRLGRSRGASMAERESANP